MFLKDSFTQSDLCRLRYASEVDVEFVRKSIKAIGQCAIKIEAAADRCVNVLLDLIATRVSYVVQEAVVVMKAGLL
jgi:vesicle coat complex subunit